MAGDINVVTLVGRVTRDSDLRYTASGSAICNFSIAVNRRVKKGSEWKDAASFFDLSLWDKQAENLQKYLVKGTQVVVFGELRQDQWEKDGQRHSKTSVFVKDVQLVGRGGPVGASGQSSSSPAQDPAEESFNPEDYEDDIPF